MFCICLCNFCAWFVSHLHMGVWEFLKLGPTRPPEGPASSWLRPPPPRGEFEKSSCSLAKPGWTGKIFGRKRRKYFLKKRGQKWPQNGRCWGLFGVSPQNFCWKSATQLEFGFFLTCFWFSSNNNISAIRKRTPLCLDICVKCVWSKPCTCDQVWNFNKPSHFWALHLRGLSLDLFTRVCIAPNAQPAQCTIVWTAPPREVAGKHPWLSPFPPTLSLQALWGFKKITKFWLSIVLGCSKEWNGELCRTVALRMWKPKYRGACRKIAINKKHAFSIFITVSSNHPLQITWRGVKM